MRSAEVAAILGIPLTTLQRTRTRLGLPTPGTGRQVDWSAAETAGAFVAGALLDDGPRSGTDAYAIGRTVTAAWTESTDGPAGPPRYVAAAIGPSGRSVAAAWSTDAAWAAVAPLAAQGHIVRYVRIPEMVPKAG